MASFTLQALREWAPFSVDALGMVTLLGAEQVDLVLGQLTWNAFAEWLPLLGAYVVASNHITQPLPGFTLYNTTDAIQATDLTGWFTRWILCRNFTPCSCTVRIFDAAVTTGTNNDMHRRQRRRAREEACAYAVGIISLAPLIFAVLIHDWWGLANAISMLASVAVRQTIQWQNRAALDHAVAEAAKICDEVKILVTIPNGTIITVYTTRGIVLECLLTALRQPSPRLYGAARAIGWIMFGVHIISLGMACLLSQILTVVILISATLLATRQIETNTSWLGRRLCLEVASSNVKYRSATYARLGLTPEEETSMVRWNLFPHETNSMWWNNYREASSQGNSENWSQILATGSAKSIEVEVAQGSLETQEVRPSAC